MGLVNCAMLVVPLPSQNATHSALLLRSPGMTCAHSASDTVAATVQLSLSTPASSTVHRWDNRGMEPAKGQA